MDMVYISFQRDTSLIFSRVQSAMEIINCITSQWDNSYHIYSHEKQTNILPVYLFNWEKDNEAIIYHTCFIKTTLWII